LMNIEQSTDLPNADRMLAFGVADQFSLLSRP